MDISIILSLIISLLIISIAVIFIIKNRKNNSQINYKSMFWIGIFWICLGIFFDNAFFWIVGIFLFILGYGKNEEWKSKNYYWKKLPRKERKLRIILIFLVGIITLTGLVFIFLLEKGIL